MTFFGDLQRETVEGMVKDTARPEDMVEDMEIVNISSDVCKKALKTCLRTCLRTWKLLIFR